MVDTAVFIGAIIIAITQAVKYVLPTVSGAVTIIVAILAGAVVGVADVHIGLPDITVAQGILTALAAVGVHTTAKQIG